MAAFDDLISSRSARSIHLAGGPDSRTLSRMRRGLPVRSDAVARLAKVLGIDVEIVAKVVASQAVSKAVRR